MLGLGPDRKILRIHLQRRLFLAGAHPARPRHPRRLRPAQVGDREALGPRTSDAARHGDDGLIVHAFALASSSLRAQRSNPDSLRGDSLDCFVVEPVIRPAEGGTGWLLAMTAR